MTQDEFNKLSEHLSSIVNDVPLRWGTIQNDRYDKDFKKTDRDLFEINTYEELQESVKGYQKELQDYYCHRWFLLQCSRCEEFLFYKNENVIQNPQAKSKIWDIRIDSQYQIKGESFLSTHYFDVKGARIPTSFIKDNKDFAQTWNAFFDVSMKDPRGLIRYFYENQSDGVRLDMQNRLFFVHYSYKDYNREMYLRTAWDAKAAAAKAFIDNINDIVLYSYRGCTTGVIYILERSERELDFYIPGL